LPRGAPLVTVLSRTISGYIRDWPPSGMEPGALVKSMADRCCAGSARGVRGACGGIVDK